MRPNKIKKEERLKITIEIKKEIVQKYEKGVRQTDLCKQYNFSKSTIATILKKADFYKELDVAKGVSILSYRRNKFTEKMETLLLVWINDIQLKGDSLSQNMICLKAQSIYKDLTQNLPSTSSTKDIGEEFKASKGWFDKFKNRTGIHSVVRHGEGASANKEAAEKFVHEFQKLMQSEGYRPEQVFNCDETGFFWKKMPKRTFITKEELALPGHKPMKDRLTLLFCANASGDLKIKPLLVYHSENPRVFKQHKVDRHKLNIMWKSNSRAWVTRQFFYEWMTEVFAPTVKRYLQEKGLPEKVVLILDNAPAHPPHLEENLDEEYNFIKIKFLPPNTTAILQPMDQCVISNFKKLYIKALFERCFEVITDTKLTLRDFWKNHFNILHCVRLINQAWGDVSVRTLQSAWKKVWPDCVNGDALEGHEDKIEIVDAVVLLGKAMHLEVDEADIEELVEENNGELTTEELQELRIEQENVREEKEEQMSSENENNNKKKTVQTSDIKKILHQWGELKELVNKWHPNQAVVSRATNIFDDNVINHFTNVLRKRRTQSTLDCFLKLSSPKKHQESTDDK